MIPDRRRAGQHVGLADGETDPRSHGVPERRRQRDLVRGQRRPAAGAARTPPAADRPSRTLSAGPRPGPGGVRPGQTPARRPCGRRCRPSAGSRTAGWRPGPDGPDRRASGRLRSGRTRPAPPAARRAVGRRRGRPGSSGPSGRLSPNGRRASSRPSRAGRRSSRPYCPTTAASGRARACTGTSGSGRSTGTPGRTGRPRCGRARRPCRGTHPKARSRPRPRSAARSGPTPGAARRAATTRRAPARAPERDPSVRPHGHPTRAADISLAAQAAAGIKAGAGQLASSRKSPEGAWGDASSQEKKEARQ